VTRVDSSSYYGIAREKLFANIDFEKLSVWSEIFKESNLNNGFFTVWDELSSDSTSYQFK